MRAKRRAARDSAANRWSLMESLEPRQLLSGNVFALVAAGNLFVVGDAVDNDIILSPGALAGQVQIASGATTATTVDHSTTPVTLAGVTGSIIVALGRGDDRLEVSGLTVPGQLVADMGVGSNHVNIDSHTQVQGSMVIVDRGINSQVTVDMASVNGSVVLKGGFGANTVSIDTLTVNHAMVIQGGPSADTVTADVLHVAGSLVVKSGWGNDTATLTNSTITHAAVFSGTDVSLDTCTVGGALVVVAGPLDGNVSVTNSTVTGPMVLRSGAGTDTVTLAGSTFHSAAVIRTGIGADTVNINGSTFDGVFVLSTGLGADTVNIATTDNVTFARAAIVALGPGDDHLTLGNSGAGSFATFNGPAIANGGLGTDTLTYQGNHNVFAVTPVLVSFETIN